MNRLTVKPEQPNRIRSICDHPYVSPEVTISAEMPPAWPKGGRVVRHSRWLDTTRRYLTDAPTPENLAQTLKSVDHGDIAAMVELNEEMEAKDAHLQGVAEMRRQALTALPWDIMPDSKLESDRKAIEAADFVREELENLATWPETLEHLATAIGPGIAVVELVWRRGRLVQTVDVPGHRLTADLWGDPGVFVETEEHPVDGVRAAGNKWVVFTPISRAGFPLRVCITRAQVWLWVMKHFGRADWASFAEVYGQPARVATYDPAAPPEDKDEIWDMLQNMGSDLCAMFPQGIDFKFLEAARGSQPFKEMIAWIEEKQTILYLGQTLTTTAGPVGSLALGRVHDNVRTDITLSDMQKETRMLRRHVLAPMVKFRWPQVPRPVPIFKRRVIEEKNLDAERLELDKLRFMREAQLPVASEVIYERLGYPMPEAEAAPITRPPIAPSR